MNFRYFLAALLAGPAAVAQPAPPSPLQPAQTIALSPHTALAGTIQLPNHHAVLLLTDTESPTLHLQCLTPSGKTAWEANVERQRKLYSGYNAFYPIGEVLPVNKPSDYKQQFDDFGKTRLVGIQVLTDGNTVYVVERIGEMDKKAQKEHPSLRERQVFVQRIDEKGQVTKVTFEPPALPEGKVTQATMGRYVADGDYVEIVRETNKREETEQFFLRHHNLATRQVRNEPLTLPAVAEHKGTNSFKEWYQDWAYLGHLPNKTYLCRRQLGTDDSKKRGQQPLLYEVLVLDDKGASTGGFSTTLDLPKGNMVYHSGSFNNSGELDHIPRIHKHSSGNRDISYDGWDAFTGNMGSFWLDRATGDVVIYGEYGPGNGPGDITPFVQGYFQRRYSPTGQVSQQFQTAYTKELQKGKKDNLFRGGNNTAITLRQARFHHDPLINQDQYSFWVNDRSGPSQMLDLFLDPSGKLKRTYFTDDADKDTHLYTVVVTAEPNWNSKNADEAHDYRVFEAAAKDDAPVYAALEKLRRAGGAKMPFQEFHLVPGTNGNGLVVERKAPAGGSLQVYTF